MEPRSSARLGDVEAAMLYFGGLAGGTAGAVGGHAGMAGVPWTQLEIDVLKQLTIAGAIAKHGGPCLAVALHYLPPSIPTRMWTLSTKPKITTKIAKPI